MTEEKETQATEEEKENNLKITALSAAVSSGFLSGFTSAANQVTIQLLKRKLTPDEIKAYSDKALQGADTWYVPTFLGSPEGQAIADILGVELPELAEEEEAELPGTEIEVEES